jgi:uncharacterized protein YajQ (UPF0234 family)
VALFSSEQNKLATKYLDAGDLMKCRQVLKENVDYLNINAMLCPKDSVRLKGLAVQNDFQLEQLQGVTSNKDAKANLARKSFRYYQNAVDVQQRASNIPTPKGK